MECKLLFPYANEDFFQGEVHEVLGRGHDIFCAPVVCWVFYGKHESFLCCRGPGKAVTVCGWVIVV